MEWSEVTYASVAAEALLRSLSHPHRNSSVSVLSTAFACPNYNSSTTATVCSHRHHSIVLFLHGFACGLTEACCYV